MNGIKPKRNSFTLRTELILGAGMILSLAIIGTVIGYLSIRNLQISTQASHLTESSNGAFALWVSAGLSIFLGIMATAGFVHWVLRPLNQLSDTAQKISEGVLTTRANGLRGAELVTLGDSLNRISDKLKETLTSLEQHVEEHRRDIERQNKKLQAAAEIAAEINSTVASFAPAAIQPEDLLNRIALSIRERFDYSLVRIFLLDDTGKWAVLRAWTGDHPQNSLGGITGNGAEGNSEAIQIHHDDSNPILRAIENSQPEFSSTSTDLSTTGTELALPIMTEGHITGILDVFELCDQRVDQITSQTRLVDDMDVLQILASYIAFTIYNAQHLQELQEQLREFETLYASQSQETWQRIAQTGLRGYQYNHKQISYLTESQLDENGEPANDGNGNLIRSNGNLGPITIPIVIRGQTIGSMDVWPGMEGWSEGNHRMLQAIGDRLNQAIDSARLFEEVQRRASRERLLNQLTARFTQSLNRDILLKTAVEELGHLPDIAQASILIGAFPSEPMETGFLTDLPTAFDSPKALPMDQISGQVGLLYQTGSQDDNGTPVVVAKPTKSIPPEIHQALQENRSILFTQSSIESTEEVDVLAIPIHLRGQVFGVLHLRFKSKGIAQDILITFEEISNRLSLVLENTRLHHETEQRAEREQMISEITSHVRSSTNVDVIMQTAIQELAEKLDVSTVTIQILDGNGEKSNG